jgi:hypothetical protein
MQLRDLGFGFAYSLQCNAPPMAERLLPLLPLAAFTYSSLLCRFLAYSSE